MPRFGVTKPRTREFVTGAYDYAKHVSLLQLVVEMLAELGELTHGG